MKKFYLYLDNFSELEIYILEFPSEIVVPVLFQAIIYIMAFIALRKCKNSLKYVAFFWYKVFVC